MSGAPHPDPLPAPQGEGASGAPHPDPLPAPQGGGARGPLAGDAVLLLITAVWGCTFVTVKDALGDADPLTFLALRFSLGAAVAAALAGRRLFKPSVWRGGAVLGVLLFIGYAFQTSGLAHTSPSRSAFITGLAVVLVPFASIVLFRRAPPLPALAGAAAALLGLVQLTGVDFAGPTRLGDLLTLGCAVAYAFHIALTERYAATEHPVALVAVQLLVTAGLSALAIPFGAPRLNPTPALLAAVALTGVVASALAISLQVWAQARTSAVRAAVIFALEPVFAVALVALLGRERPGPRELAGGALIVLGVLISEVGSALAQRRRRKATA